MSDLISRQAAIDAIEPTLKSILQGNSFKAINVIDKIRDLPSVEPERKRGHWIDEDVFDVDENCDRIIEEWQSARCSVCGKYHTTPYMYYFDVYNYCPNCGARMEGKDE